MRISHGTQSLIHVKAHCTFSADHASPVPRCLAGLYRPPSVPDESRTSAPPLQRLSPQSVLPSASPASRRTIAIRTIILPRVCRALLRAMPSVTIVVELSHTLDLMDSRRLLRGLDREVLSRFPLPLLLSQSHHLRVGSSLSYNICPLSRCTQWARRPRGTSRVEKEARLIVTRGFESSRELQLRKVFDMLGSGISRFRVTMLCERKRERVKENLILNFLFKDVSAIRYELKVIEI